MAYSTTAQVADDPNQDPQGYLSRMWEKFVDLGPKILDLQHRAAVIAARAREQGDTERAEQAVAVIRSLHNLGKVHMLAVDKAEQYGSYIGLGSYRAAGLSGLPVAVAAALSALALLVAWVFRSYDAEARKLDLIEEGILTPEQAAALDPGPQPAGLVGAAQGVIMWAVLAAVGLMVARHMLDAPRRNPPLVVYGANPPGTIGEDVHAVYYRHAEDGQFYVHEFEGGVELEALPDGTVLLHGPDPLWEEF